MAFLQLEVAGVRLSTVRFGGGSGTFELHLNPHPRFALLSKEVHMTKEAAQLRWHRKEVQK